MGWLSNIFRIVIPVVAAVIGFVISGFNPMGAVYGFGLGMAIGGALFPPEAENKQSGGPGQLQLSTSNYGGAIPVAYGARRVAGNLIWAGPLVTVAVENDAGGGGCAGGDSTYTTYEYYISFAMAVCVGPGRKEVRRIFKNKDEYIYDRRTGKATSITSADMPIGKTWGDVMAFAAIAALVTGETSTTRSQITATLYDGTQTTADPTMTAAVANPCPYKNLCYMVFPNYHLGNVPMMPQFSFEVVDVIVNENAYPKINKSVTTYDPPAIVGGLWTGGEFVAQLIYAEGYLFQFIVDAQAYPVRLDKIDPDTLEVVATAPLPLGSDQTINTNYNCVCYQAGFIYLTTANTLAKISCSSLAIHRQWFLGTITVGYPPPFYEPWYYGAKFASSMDNDSYRPEMGADWADWWVKLGPVLVAGEWSADGASWVTGTTIRGANRHIGIYPGISSDYVTLLMMGQADWSFDNQIWYYGAYYIVNYRLKDAAIEIADGPDGVNFSSPMLSPGFIPVGDYKMIYSSDNIVLIDSDNKAVNSMGRDSLNSRYIRHACYFSENDTIYVVTQREVWGISVPELTVTYGPYSFSSSNNNSTLTICMQVDSWSAKVFVLGYGGYWIFDTSLNLLEHGDLEDLEGFTNSNGLIAESYGPVLNVPFYNVRGVGSMYFWSLTPFSTTVSSGLLKLDYPPDFLFQDDVTPQEVTEDILTNKFYGNGMESDIIDTEENTKGKYYAREMDMLIAPAFDRQRSVLDALQYVIQHHDGFITYYEGKIAHRQFEIRSEDIAFTTDSEKSDGFGDGVAGDTWRQVIE